MPGRIAEHIKAVRGTSRPGRRITPTASARLLRVPEAPEHLSDAAKREWRALAAVLTERGVLTRADLRALELLCETLASASHFTAIIASQGSTIAAGGGGTKGHPALQALATARAQARALLADFGLSPKARGAVDVAPEGPSANRPLTGLARFRK